MADVDDIVEQTEAEMMDSVEAMERDFAGFRTGKASPGLVEHITVDYYGAQTRLRDIAGITAPEPRLLVVQPWDTSAIKSIEKALESANLGITPQSDGRVIRLPIPELSEERRKDLTKQARKRAEEAKVSIRTHRRDANEEVKKAEKAGDITEDDMREMLDEIQKLTDQYSSQIDEQLEKKEAELMQV